MSISDKPSLHNAPPTLASDEEKSHDISEEAKAATANSPPDGGRKAWLTVLGAFCAAFASVGWASSIGIFQAQYETDQLRHYSTSTVSWITSMQGEYLVSWVASRGLVANRTSLFYAFCMLRQWRAV